jgi:S1-C subfamily serine protease/ribulose-5-phosphate 4-epimerase/fuculose-1-phosphate aldolase
VFEENEMAAQAKNSMPRCGMRWAGVLRRWPRRAACALVLTLSPAAAGASTAERVFATVSPSVVVVRAATSQGSGVVVAPQVVATDCQVLGEAAQITVQHGRISHAASLWRRDRQPNLCLLQVPTLEAPPVTLGEAGRLRVGATVYAVGAPEGLELSLSAGLVSQLRGAEGAPLVQTTAPISPGSSGGGLFDERGRLVGLTTFPLARGQNVYFALAMPAEWVAAALPRASSWRQCRTAPTVGCLLAEARDIVGEGGGGLGSFASSAHTAIVRAQAQAGDIAGALAAARSIEDAYWRALALADIAEAQAQAGDRQGAAQTFAQAVATARSIEHAYSHAPSYLRASASSFRASALREIVRVQALAGDIAGALATARSLEDAWVRAPAFAAIAQAQAQAGDITGALATARSIEDASERAPALADIAKAQAQAGDRQGAAQTVAQALATARSIEGTSKRAGALANIAQAQAQAGDRQGAAQTFAQALATAQSMENASGRAWALPDIAEAQAQAGDRQGAAQTFVQAVAAARSMEGAYWRAQALRHIAKKQVQAGDIAGALATIDEISDQARRAEALAEVASHLAQRR